MGCFRYKRINTPHKGDKKDGDDNNNKAGKAAGMCHTEWFMQISGSQSSVVENRGLLECDRITFPAILKDHCVCILRGKQSKNQSSPLGLPTLNPFHTCWGAPVIITKRVSSSCDVWFTRCIFDFTGFSNEMRTIHLMQPSFALKVYLYMHLWTMLTFLQM